ncbi:hypothetical protein L1N85_12190 [Paenibacillus alkaliterrae]|uniref:hypothetical protein n=1 Tax=Paenibacillus alkaliterrae TaxID=320909 RepID=UPI0039EDFAA7|nr:hypothetical protein [Paenibacillus alkaliterrae]
METVCRQAAERTSLRLAAVIGLSSGFGPAASGAAAFCEGSCCPLLHQGPVN